MNMNLYDAIDSLNSIDVTQTVFSMNISIEKYLTGRYFTKQAALSGD